MLSSCINPHMDLIVLSPGHFKRQWEVVPAAADHLKSCVHLEKATIIPGNRKIAFNTCVSEVAHAGVFCLLHSCDLRTPSVTAAWWLWCV